VKKAVLVVTLLLAAAMPVLLFTSPGTYGYLYAGGFVALLGCIPTFLIVAGLRRWVDHRLKRIAGAVVLNALCYPLAYCLLSWLFGDAAGGHFAISISEMTQAQIVRLAGAGAVVGFIIVILVELMQGHPYRDSQIGHD
jgi:hypothetical protein